MPGIAHKIDNTSNDSNDTNTNYKNPLARNGYNSFNGSSVSSIGFWSKHRDDVSYNQLQKFWCELTPQARQKLLRIDKQTLFEHARKNMYCSRCNGLLLEGFLQIVMYGKSLQQDAAGAHHGGGSMKNQNDDDLCMANGCKDDVLDPSVHPWGGLSTGRDGTLTLLDCYLYSKSLKGLQNVFDSARARERERKLLYPDACGGGGRGWLSQGLMGYGRGHGTRETCALHTARLSVETLVDFWSALGEETRQSLLRMKEEDFIERLMYRFDSKRFCRDCRRNVIREFKELKELKRMRREPRCTSWFCVADTAFQYEVSCDTVQADWHQTFLDALGTYHHFEWAIGTGEGKSDILEFENVGLSGKVQVNGLDLSGLNACYITLRAWKMDGRCNELCVKAHALQGQQCVHCRLVVGDGYVTITRGESIRRFFEHAEEAEEEEDDESMDKDGNDLDGECSRPQKHAKSPELAREFLLDAATVIFKEQACLYSLSFQLIFSNLDWVTHVEKAFREGTARQNAHSIFVCLALKLLEERVHVACKEIITLEKQMKLLEEEEKEKREEEERKERRRLKEREKKLRRKERLREKENKEKKCAESNLDPVSLDVSKKSPPCVDEGANVERSMDSVSETGELATPGIGAPLSHDHFKYSRRKLKFQKDPQLESTIKWSDRKKGAELSGNEVIVSKYESRFHADNFESMRSINGFSKQLRTNAAKFNTRNGCTKLSDTLQCANNRIGERSDSHVCSCNHHNECRSRPDSHITKALRETKYVSKLDSLADASKSYFRGRYSQVEATREINGRPKSKIVAGNPPMTKKVWEPLDSQKKYAQSNSDDVALRLKPKVENSETDQLPESSATTSSNEAVDTSVETNNEDNDVRALRIVETERIRSPHRRVDSSISSSSNSDNCSSCLSEGDSNTSSSNPQNLESASTSDSEESSPNSEARETSHCLESRFTECCSVMEDQSTTREHDSKGQAPASGITNTLGSLPTEVATYCGSGRANISLSVQPQSVPPQMHSQNIPYPVFHAPSMGYYHQGPLSWQTGPTNGLMSYPHSNHYLFANAFGYDLNGNGGFMQYGALQHLAPPLLNPAHVPVYPLVAQANGVSTKEHCKGATLCVPREVHHSINKVDSAETRSAETPTVVDARQNGKSDKIDKGNNGFSLFHFGGPVALSTGFSADPVSLKEGTMGNTALDLSDNSADGNHPCNKKDSIEEYNLFAASNGINVSTFYTSKDVVVVLPCVKELFCAVLTNLVNGSHKVMPLDVWSSRIGYLYQLLGLTVPTLRFIRRYPTLFEEYPHPKYPSLACFKLTQLGKMMQDKEIRVFEECEGDVVERLCRLLMMTRNKLLPLQSLHPLKWDLGLPDDFDKNLIRKYPDHFRLVKSTNGLNCLKLVEWREEFSVSMLQKLNEKSIGGSIDDNNAISGYREFKRGKAALEFPMSFPRGYGAQKKVKAWMDEFQKLPYISPYEDSRGIDPNSELMEKRVVGVLHELLSLTIYKKTKRNYLRSLREELNLPHKFTRIFTRYPGIFYLSLKCKTTTVALREGYRRGRLVDPHPLARHRDKLHYVMRTGLIYRSKAADMLPHLDSLVENVEDHAGEEESDEEEIIVDDEYNDSEAETGSDED
ncbi:UNVERIFIED_CONTAM: protein WHAT'S THIS FACTOR 9, mitochondrial [Sesamum angustifolium]|uniref:Protein WHAT'S THIS FACTOR 9, mitochondrial n=1 Tax=Sesamum angustifolium TaxID=2727405 RepID=A0AAW2MT29_9LAMI